MKPWSLIFFCVFLLPLTVRAEGEWEKRGSITVSQQGLVETRLLPGLHAMIDQDRFDLTLTGPDNRPRALELFMDDRREGQTLELTPKNVRLTAAGSFVWEADGPPMTASSLSVTVSESRFVATVLAEGLKAGQWRVLSKNEALYKTGSVSRADFSIPAGRYRAFRLTFAGFDRRNERKILPISRVTVRSTEKSIGFEGLTVPLGFDREETADHVELKARLDGSGFFIRTLRLESQAPFMGRFELGREDVREGRLVFIPVKTGSQEALNSGSPALTLDLDQRWPGHSLVLRLFPRGKFIGQIKTLELDIQPPRILFSADRPGVYHLTTGQESPQPLLDYAHTDKTATRTRADLSDLETRSDRHIRHLVEKYPFEGGPFRPKGYTWQAGVHVSEPGYYRLIVHPKADLSGNRNGIRIVRKGVQVPFLFSSPYDKTLPLAVVSSYDEKTNQSHWEMSLPMPSEHWNALKIHAVGMFSRNVECLIKKAGYTGWKPWRTLHWTNSESNETTLLIPLDPVACESGRFLIRIAHKDNRPMTLSAAEASFSSTDLLFPARVPGAYTVYGGHLEAEAPVYDLSLVKDDLLAAIPTDIPMPEPSALGSTPIRDSASALFHGKSWGLYVVLGLVTLILMGLVTRLFPKSPDEPE